MIGWIRMPEAVTGMKSSKAAVFFEQNSDREENEREKITQSTDKNHLKKSDKSQLLTEERVIWNGMMSLPRVVEIENGQVCFRVHPNVRKGDVYKRQWYIRPGSDYHLCNRRRKIYL